MIRLLIFLLFLSGLGLSSALGQEKTPRTPRKPVNPYRKTYQQGQFVAPIEIDSASPKIPYVHFPYPLPKGTNRATLGVTFTTSPRDITEEIQISIPAGDLTVLHGLTDKLAITGRFTFQFLQNYGSAGIRYSVPVKGRFYASAGADLGTWFGSLQLAQFNNRGFGVLAAPNMAIGFRSSRELLVTFRGEIDLGVYYRSRVGKTVTDRSGLTLNGYGATVTLEQAFFGRRHVALGFRALYTNFNWQFWSLYDTFDRNIFYPEAFIGFFL
ncbi:MAG TPA: hypothetical protein VGA96_18390 [Fibrella sp.]|jgi:hypothetical protein